MNLEQRAFALRHLYVYPALSIAYTYIPKNACTSMKATLGKGQGWWSEESGSAHEMSALHWLGGLVRYRATDERIVIIRDPLDRLVSAFQSRFLVPKDSVSEEAMAHGLAAGLPEGAERTDVTFSQFVGYVANTPDRRLNEHWRPQCNFLVGEYSRMLRFEHLSGEADFLASRGLRLMKVAGHGTSGFRQNLGPGWGDKPAIALRRLKRRRGILPDRGSMYDEGLYTKVADRFAADIELFDRLSRTITN